MHYDYSTFSKLKPYPRSYGRHGVKELYTRFIVKAIVTFKEIITFTSSVLTLIEPDALAPVLIRNFSRGFNVGFFTSTPAVC